MNMIDNDRMGLHFLSLPSELVDWRRGARSDGSIGFIFIDLGLGLENTGR